MPHKTREAANAWRRAWMKTPAGKALKARDNARYRSTANGKTATMASIRRNLLRYPWKRRARSILHYAIRKGEVTKPDSCSECGLSPDNSRLIHGHHEDYSRPLDVVWLCLWCHVEADKKKVQPRGIPTPPTDGPPPGEAP